MAKAIVNGIEQAYKDLDGNLAIIVGGFYGGADVPGTFDRFSVVVNASSITTVAQLGAAISAAVRSDAIGRGFTVPASAVLLPSYVTA